MDNKLLTLSEAAEIAGVSYNRMYKLADKGKIETVKLTDDHPEPLPGPRQKLHVPEASLRKWMENRKKWFRRQSKWLRQVDYEERNNE